MGKIAVIGFSGQFPGAKNLNQYWDNIAGKSSSIKQFSNQDLLSNGVSPQILKSPSYIPAKGYLENADFFDADYFKINDRDALILDPQFRLFLECVHEALYVAGYNKSCIENSSIGLFTSASSLNSYYKYYKSEFEKAQISEYSAFINTGNDFLATFVANKLGLTGPATSVQTACSSSLVSVCLACDSLLQHNCNVAISGGVSLSYPLVSGYFYQEGMIYSPTGLCQPFTNLKSGVVPGNGLGTVVLKRLEDAITDKDKIYAVISGYAVNNDGKNKIGYTAPSIKGQTEVISKALLRASINFNDLDYIECHGAGTNLGDEVEIEALKLLAVNTKNFTYIGSVKSNIGHLDVASGIAGMLKVIMSLSTRQLLPTLYINNNNLHTALNGARLQPVINKIDLSKKKSLRMGVSSFGVGGTNAHVILESFGDNKAASKSFYVPNFSYQRKQYSFMLAEESSSNLLNKYGFVPFWEQVSININNNPDIRKTYLIFSGQDKFTENLIKNLRDQGNQIIVVREKPINLLNIHIGDIEINFDDKNYIKKIISVLNNKDIIPNIILHAFFLNPEASKNYNSVIEKGFLLTKNFLQGFGFNLLNRSIFCVLTNEYLGIDSNKINLPNISILTGMLQSITQEYKNIICKHIDISGNSDLKLIISQVLESKEPILILKNNMKFIRSFKPLELNQKIKKEKGFKVGGAYLITGGLSGIGLDLAYYLAEKFHAKLILISRKKIKPESCWNKLSQDKNIEISKLYEKLIFIKKQADYLFINSTDISNLKEFAKTVENAEEKTGFIKGVIHAAGVAGAGMLYQISDKAVIEGIKAKVTGAININDVFKNKNLDFIILCSALTSLTGSQGQSIYCSANAFLDAFANHYNSDTRKIISINWDTWKETGMAARLAKKLNNFENQNTSKISMSIKDWYFTEHKVLNKKTLPGTAYLDLILNNLNKKNKLFYPLEISNINFIKLLQPEVKKIELFMRFNLQEKLFNEITLSYCDEMHFSIGCIEINRTLKVHENILLATALSKIVFEQPPSFDKKNRNILLGDHWKCLKGITKFDKFQVAKIKLLPNFKSEINNHTLHPAMLDVATSFFIIGNYLPYQIYKIKVYRKINTSLIYSFASQHKFLKNGDVKISEIKIFDESGEIILEMQDYILRRMNNHDNIH